MQHYNSGRKIGFMDKITFKNWKIDEKYRYGFRKPVSKHLKDE